MTSKRVRELQYVSTEYGVTGTLCDRAAAWHNDSPIDDGHRDRYRLGCPAVQNDFTSSITRPDRYTAQRWWLRGPRPRRVMCGDRCLISTVTHWGLLAPRYAVKVSSLWSWPSISLAVIHRAAHFLMSDVNFSNWLAQINLTSSHSSRAIQVRLGLRPMCQRLPIMSERRWKTT